MTIDKVLVTPVRGVARVELEHVRNVLELTNQSGTLYLWYERDEAALSSIGKVYIVSEGMTTPPFAWRLNSIQKNGRKQIYFEYVNE